MEPQDDPQKDPIWRALRAREDMALGAILIALGGAFGYGRVALAARKVWAAREPEFEKINREIEAKPA